MRKQSKKTLRDFVVAMCGPLVHITSFPSMLIFLLCTTFSNFSNLVKGLFIDAPPPPGGGGHLKKKPSHQAENIVKVSQKLVCEK